MLNFIYWPISAIMWFWHQAASLVLDPSSGLSWVLAIVLLVVTIRLLLFRPMFKSQRSMLKMQKMQPLMQEVRNKYKNDQQKQAMEMRRIQKEMGVNPLRGCLPMLVQIPVFLGLFHVIRSFNRTGEGVGQVGISLEENWNTSNYMFSVGDVQSFLSARLFGAPMSGSIGMSPDQYAAFVEPGAAVDITRFQIAVVAIPMMVLSAAFIHFNARVSVNRTQDRLARGLQQKAPGPMGDQTELMNKLMLWFFPLMILATGAIWSVGLLVYMLTNNIWTYFQQRYVFGKLDAEEAAEIEAEKEAKRQAQAKLAPKVGAKPKKNKKNKGGAQHPVEAEGTTSLDDVDVVDAPTASDDAQVSASEDAGATADANVPDAPQPGAAPRPGQRSGNKKKKKRK